MPGPMPSVRAEAARALVAVLDHGRSIESCVDRVGSDLSDRDLGLFRELVSGTVRWLAFLDSVIERAADRPLSCIDRGLRNHLRLGAYQLLFLDRVPARAAVHEAVELAKRTAETSGSGVGAARFVNAVLRTVARSPQRDSWTVSSNDPVAELALNYSHPLALVRAWNERFGLEATRQLLATNNRPKASLGVMSGDRRALAKDLRGRGGTIEDSQLSPLGLVVRGMRPEQVVAAGGYIQDEASQAAALVPPPRPGERVFDASAAPGGKVLALAAAERRVSIVAAADLRLDRLARLTANLRRSALQPTPILAADALTPALAAGVVDRVIFDAPCSGSGTLRKHPELKWRITPEEIGRLARLQLAGLEALASLLHAGGRLCYATCSIEAAENEDVVAAFLGRHPDWQLESLEAWPEIATRSIASGGWQVLPDGEHDGATVHVLRFRPRSR